MARRFAGAGQYRRRGRTPFVGLGGEFDFSKYGAPWLHLNDEAADITESGGLVSAWTDKTGNNTVVQATALNQPTFLGEGLGVDFVTNDSLDLTTAALNQNVVTVFADVDVRSTGTIRFFLDLNNGVGNRGLFAWGGTANAISFFDGGAYRSTGTVVPTGRNKMVLEVNYGAGTFRAFQNNTLIGSVGTVANNPNIGSDMGRISESATSSAGYCDMILYRIVVYGQATAFTDSQRNEISDAL